MGGPTPVPSNHINPHKCRHLCRSRGTWGRLDFLLTRNYKLHGHNTHRHFEMSRVNTRQGKTLVSLHLYPHPLFILTLLVTPDRRFYVVLSVVQCLRKSNLLARVILTENCTMLFKNCCCTNLSGSVPSPGNSTCSARLWVHFPYNKNCYCCWTKKIESSTSEENCAALDCG